MAEPPYIMSPLFKITNVGWSSKDVILFFFATCDDRSRDDSDDDFNFKITWKANIEGQELTMIRLHEELTQDSTDAVRWVQYIKPEPDEPDPDAPPEPEPPPRPEITEDITPEMRSWYTAFLEDTHVQRLVRTDIPDVPYKADRVVLVIFPSKIKKDGPNWDEDKQEYVFTFNLDSEVGGGAIVSGKVEMCVQVVKGLSWVNKLGVIVPSDEFEVPPNLATRPPGKPTNGKPNDDYEGGNPLIPDEDPKDRMLTFFGDDGLFALNNTPLTVRLKRNNETKEWSVTENSWDVIGE